MGAAYLDEFAQGRQEIAPPQAHHAAECRAFEAVPGRVAPSDGRPASMLHRHSSAGMCRFEEDFNLGALLGSEIGVAPREDETRRGCGTAPGNRSDALLSTKRM